MNEILQAGPKARVMAYLNHTASVVWNKGPMIDEDTEARLLNSFQLGRGRDAFIKYSALDKKIRLYIQYVNELHLVYLYNSSKRKYYKDLKPLLLEASSQLRADFPKNKRLEKLLNKFSINTNIAAIELITAIDEYYKYIKANKISIRAHTGFIRELCQDYDEIEKDEMKTVKPDPVIAGEIKEHYL